MIISDTLKQKLIKYERMLQKPNAYTLNELSLLLDDSFYEIGQSGKFWGKGDILAYFNNFKLHGEDEVAILNRTHKLN